MYVKAKGAWRGACGAIAELIWPINLTQKRSEGKMSTLSQLTNYCTVKSRFETLLTKQDLLWLYVVLKLYIPSAVKTWLYTLKQICKTQQQKTNLNRLWLQPEYFPILAAIVLNFVLECEKMTKVVLISLEAGDLESNVEFSPGYPYSIATQLNHQSMNHWMFLKTIIKIILMRSKSSNSVLEIWQHFSVCKLSV